MRGSLISLKCISSESSITSATGAYYLSMLNLITIIIYMYRLQKLQTVFNTAEVYSSLSLSHIEGIETLNSRFQLAVTTLKKKPYDVLDHRKSVFESDFEDFQRQLSDINVSLYSKTEKLNVFKYHANLF